MQYLLEGNAAGLLLARTVWMSGCNRVFARVSENKTLTHECIFVRLCVGQTGPVRHFPVQQKEAAGDFMCVGGKQ